MKKIIALFLALIMMLSFTACGSNAEATSEPTTVPTTEPFDVEEYNTLVSDCVSQIYDSTVVVSNIINFECKYLQTFKKVAGASSTPSLESVVETGIMGLEEYSDYTEESVKEQYNNISEMYNSIIISGADHAEVNEIQTVFTEMYEAYDGFYKLAFSPELDLGALATSHDEHTKIIVNCKSTLENLL